MNPRLTVISTPPTSSESVIAQQIGELAMGAVCGKAVVACAAEPSPPCSSESERTSVLIVDAQGGSVTLEITSSAPLSPLVPFDIVRALRGVESGEPTLLLASPEEISEIREKGSEFNFTLFDRDSGVREPYRLTVRRDGVFSPVPRGAPEDGGGEEVGTPSRALVTCSPDALALGWRVMLPPSTVEECFERGESSIELGTCAMAVIKGGLTATQFQAIFEDHGSAGSILRISEDDMAQREGIALTIGEIALSPEQMLEVKPGAEISLEGMDQASATLLIDGHRWAEVEISIREGNLHLKVRELYRLP